MGGYKSPPGVVLVVLLGEEKGKKDFDEEFWRENVKDAGRLGEIIRTSRDSFDLSNIAAPDLVDMESILSSRLHILKKVSA